MKIDKTQAGLSLLELLLVLVVVGLIVTVAGLSVTSGSRPYAIEAAVTGFSRIAEYAMDEAQLSGADMGLLFEVRNDASDVRYSYVWMQRQGLEWVRTQRAEELFTRRDFPAGLVLELEIEGSALNLLEQAADNSVLPQVIFYSSGATTPGLLRWLDSDNGDLLWQLEWDLIAQMDLRRRGDANDEN